RVSKKPLDDLAINEFIDGEDHGKFLWMNACWAYGVCVANAFMKYGWFARIQGLEGGGVIEGLPTIAAPADDGSLASNCPSEIAIRDARAFELSTMGFLPLLYNRARECAFFGGAHSCRQPMISSDTAVNRRAELEAKLDYTLCLSRFAHYL